MALISSPKAQHELPDLLVGADPVAERSEAVQDEPLHAQRPDHVADRPQEDVQFVRREFLSLQPELLVDHREVHEDEGAVGDEVGAEEFERGEVLDELPGRLGHREEQGAFSAFRSAKKELEAQRRLPGPYASRDEDGVPAGDPPSEDVVQPLDAGDAALENGRRFHPSRRYGFRRRRRGALHRENEPVGD